MLNPLLLKRCPIPEFSDPNRTFIALEKRVLPIIFDFSIIQLSFEKKVPQYGQCSKEPLKINIISKLVGMCLLHWYKLPCQWFEEKTFLAIEFQKETCYEWNLHWNLIKRYCLASHSKCVRKSINEMPLYSLFCDWQKWSLKHCMCTKKKEKKNSNAKPKSDLTIFGVCRYYFRYHLHLRLHEELIGIDSNSFHFILFQFMISFITKSIHRLSFDCTARFH